MSCAIGLVHGKEIWLAAEGRGSTDEGVIRHDDCDKIFKNGLYTIAFVGSVRTGQILMPKHFEPPKDIAHLPDAIQARCVQQGCIGQGESGLQMASNFLVVFKGKLYEILVDFQIKEVKDYSSVGSGSAFAYGSLFSTTSNMSPEDRLAIALGAASRFSAECGGAFKIVKCK